jgi:hypothetical protein
MEGFVKGWGLGGWKGWKGWRWLEGLEELNVVGGGRRWLEELERFMVKVEFNERPYFRQTI